MSVHGPRYTGCRGMSQLPMPNCSDQSVSMYSAHVAPLSRQPGGPINDSIATDLSLGKDRPRDCIHIQRYNGNITCCELSHVPGAPDIKMGDRVSDRPSAIQSFSYLHRVRLQKILNDFVLKPPERHATFGKF